MLRSLRLSLLVLVVVCIALLAVGAAEAKNNVGSLTNWPVPTSPDVDKFIRDQTAAAQLGKALFWDMQAGSDGRTACASCHFNAGADNRSRNQLNPHGDPGFAANQQLTVSDFPIADERVVGSQGVVPSAFKGIADGNPFDMQDWAPVDTAFHVGSVNVRRTTGRNTPSAINAVFNFRNFWDGRAQNEFNGVDPFGARETSARVGLVGPDGTATPISLTDDAAAAHGFTLNNSSLASQADGPPGNPVEMSSDGRTLSDIGKKLMSVRPLGEQQVSPSDSVLGSDIAPGGKGLNTSYADLIRAAFKPQWWNSDENLVAATAVPTR